MGFLRGMVLGSCSGGPKVVSALLDSVGLT